LNWVWPADPRTQANVAVVVRPNFFESRFRTAPAQVSIAEQLERFEARRTHQRIAELIDNPLSGEFDLARLKAIHLYIFEDVYEWAG
jgi:fido (protein-threonine AMPylation protein)